MGQKLFTPLPQTSNLPKPPNAVNPKEKKEGAAVDFYL